jgi:hypothetical protein
MLKSRKNVRLLLGTALFSFELSATNFDLIIRDNLGENIKVSPVLDVGVFQLEGDVVIPSKSDRKYPTIHICDTEINEAMLIANGQTKNITVQLGDIDFSSIGIAKGNSIVQRLEIKKNNGSVVGYLSFRSSVYNTNPIVTIESNEGYSVCEEQLPHGGGTIIVVKNS